MSEINDTAVEAGVEAARQRLTWPSLHWGKSWIDPEAWPHVMRAALAAALPHLTPAPSASVEEVHAVVDEAHYDSWDNGREYEASPGAVTAALLARFNITPKEDR